MGQNADAAEQLSQGEPTTVTATAVAPANRRRLLGRGGAIAATVLGVVLALGGRGGDAAASQLRTGNTHEPQPQRTEQPTATPNASQGEHLVPTDPKNCEPYPWEPNTQPQPTHPPVGGNGNRIIFASMKKPTPEKTPNTEECWIVTPDGTRVRTTTPQSPETPQAQPTANPQQI
jgi:hypothetical protein